MRTALLLAVALAACSDPTVPAEDAAIDAVPTDGRPGIDAPIDAPGPPGPLDGIWSITWTCVHLCVPEPVLLRTQRLTIAGGALHWDSPTCSECVVDHVGMVRGTCIDVPAGLDNAQDDRGTYSICTTAESTLSATIAVRRIGGLSEIPSWRVDGARQ